MPSRHYTRIDLPLFVEEREGHMTVSSAALTLALGADATEAGAIEETAAWLAPQLVPPSGDPFVLSRVTVRVDKPELAAIDWERIVSGVEAHVRPAVVRVSPVHPRMLQSSSTIPVSVLELGAERTVAEAVQLVVSGSTDRAAVVVRSSALDTAQRTVTGLRWPTVDVLHLHDLATIEHLLRTSAGEEPGTLAWILRMSTMWKTRLIVVDSPSAPLPMLRRLGQAIVDRSGPAVILADRARFQLIELYATVFHDRPFDWAQRNVDGLAVFAGAGREEALRFSTVAERLAQQPVAVILSTVQSAASTRAERRVERSMPRGGKSLRPTPVDVAVSVRQAARQLRIKVGTRGVGIGWAQTPKRIRFGDTVAARMLDKGYVVESLDADMKALAWSNEYVPLETIAGYVTAKSLSLEHVLDPDTSPRLDDIIAERVSNLGTSVQELQFEDHEGEGTLPISLKTLHIRNLARAGRGAAAPSSAGAGVRRAPPPPRHVNARFYDLSSAGPAVPIPQEGARFTPGDAIHLGIRVGERDDLLVNFGSVAFDDKAFRWRPGQNGCWIEIGITPLDFEILGAPLQEVWLPRDGEMQLITFPLTPRSATALPGVARVRFTFYYRDNVVQSFRVVARLVAAGADASSLLAAALGVPAIPEGDLGYITRLEYSAADLAQTETLPRRSISFVANESVGQKVFTIKGQDFFSTTVNSELDSLVDDARRALKRASYNETLDEYRFSADNSAEPGDVLDRLWGAASAGWRLYKQILPAHADQAAVAELLSGEGIVHAAHVDLRQVVPWSLMYDLPIDEGRDKITVEEGGGRTTYPVHRHVCPAGFPTSDGSLPDQLCGASPQCLVHGATDGRRIVNGEVYCRETIVCPRHFWGFAHQIEVPAQQVHDSSVPERAPVVLTASRPIAVIVGYNPNFELVTRHLGELKTLANIHIQEPDPVERNEILDLLNRVQPDVIYLYCHAFVDTADSPGRYSPNLDFGKRLASDIVSSADFDGREWSRRPLVFINGCGSVGFNPAAPSGFVTSLIQGRKASVVIGTEVTVWERLATEMALKFMEQFLGEEPKSAGAALTHARRRLLLKNNPLGLVYTLYGSADLHIEFRP